MEYFLIDFENLALSNLPFLRKDQFIWVFTGEKQIKFNRELVLSAQPLGKQVEWKVIKGNGKNALDFHIAYYIGKISGQEPAASFRIISADKGFDPLVQHLKEQGIDCIRLSEFSPGKARKSDFKTLISEIVEHLRNMDTKVRPKKIAKLKAYLKNRGKQEDDEVDLIVQALEKEKQIQVKEGKVEYPFPK